jgi:hypothetical protein
MTWSQERERVGGRERDEDVGEGEDGEGEDGEGEDGGGGGEREGNSANE